ncbi:hypothetical protein ACG7TL_007849 [Trametes sanguinea]
MVASRWYTSSELLEGPTASWLQRYASNCVSEGEVDQIISALKDEGLVSDHEGVLRWRDYSDKPYVLCHPVTSSLGTVINAIVDVPLPNLSPSCRYEEEPLTIAYSETSGSQHHVGGALRLNNSPSLNAPKRSMAPTSDIAVNFAFKSEDEPEDDMNDNRWDLKTLYSASHALHSDCRRKHTYSITIEDNRVSMWYFSRSHSAKSHEFDLLDVRAVVHALSALIFSTVEDLGYDANITRISEWDEDVKENRIRYVYRLDNRFFKTLKCRSEYDDLCIVGRATRVWEVIEVTSFNDIDDIAPLPHAQRMILRDVWLEHDSETEREIQEKIFERCDELGRNFPPANDARLYGVDDATRTLLRECLRDGSYKQLFLTIEADHRGARSKPPAEGFTPAREICGESVYCSQAAIEHASYMERASTSRAPSASDASATAKPQASVPREYKPRQRNCVVYQEVCSALHELDDLYDVVQALLDALLALQILFLVSWIHRDVSSGNILLFEGRGKLSDLEYAKEFNLSIGGRSSDRRTGTPIFMAWEVHSRTTIFKERIYVVDMAAYEAEETPEPSPLVDSTLHNFQHDLESIWWILTWLVFTRIPGQDCAQTIADLFHRNFGIARQDFLTDHMDCRWRLASLRQDLPPVIRAGLLTMRVALHNGYLDRGTSTGDMASYSLIYGQFRNVLETIAAAVPRGSVGLVPPCP